jgi:predicted fused transcriptional regulator/phosphomethylpyrimidine kinase
MGPSADEVVVDGWANELANALDHVGEDARVLRQRFIVEFQLSGNQTLRYDKSLTGMDLTGDQADLALLRRLEWARGRLDPARLMDWIPAVGFNLAACPDDATSAEEVAAYPGKITVVDGALKHHSTPAMGASKSLAGLLMGVRELDPERTAVLNLRAPANEQGPRMDIIDRALNALEWNVAEAPRGVLNGNEGPVDVVLDRGGYGWEPGLYVLGHHPLDVVDRANRLMAVLHVTEATA